MGEDKKVKKIQLLEKGSKLLKTYLSSETPKIYLKGKKEHPLETIRRQKKMLFG